MVSVKTENVSKRFGEVVAVDHVTIKIEHGELFTVLGPSGCGKTTLLRIIAGFEFPDEGKVYYDDVDVTDLRPHKRDTGMVFQNYALWPHMNVSDNVSFGLKVRKFQKEEIEKKVNESLALVKLGGLEKRAPYQLSGGQQQRVALARALIINPRLLLFDEPLSNLDAKLRMEMRGEIKRLQKGLGITTIYVTHDQEEAMSISDRIAVMNLGRIEQVDKPMDIYFRPKNNFVADFIGQGTFLEGKVTDTKEYLKIRLKTGEEIHGTASDPTNLPKIGDEVLIVIRPESFEMGPNANFNIFKCTVKQAFFLGKLKRIRAEMGIWRFLIDIDPFIDLTEEEEIVLSVSPRKTLAINVK